MHELLAQAVVVGAELTLAADVQSGGALLGRADITTFALAKGLCWRAGRGTRTETDLRPWLGKRGQAGHTVPRSFPLSNQFGL